MHATAAHDAVVLWRLAELSLAQALAGSAANALAPAGAVVVAAAVTEKKKDARLAAISMASGINCSFCAQGDGGPVAAAQVPPGQAAGS